MTHIPWADISNFHNVRKMFAALPELTDDAATYRAKVKLHGTNGGVQVNSAGTISVSSRSSLISVKNDNAGFARWVDSVDPELWRRNSPDVPNTEFVIYGEWCGPGVQKGVAINEIPKRCFAVFAARETGERERFIYEPEELEKLVSGIPDAYVLPWFNDGGEFAVCWRAPSDELKLVLDRINANVLGVEMCDPWVEKQFGVKGTGEGLVFYPLGDCSYSRYEHLTFKAKGEKHQVVAHTKPAQLDPTIANSASTFAELVLPEPRLEQGARAVNDGQLDCQMKNVGAFLKWIAADLKKETASELEVSGLSEEVAIKACATRARAWYIAQAKKL